MRHYGDYDSNTVVYMEFTTTANGNSVAQSLANGNVVVFKDNSNANAVEGLTLNIDWGITGRNLVTVNTASNVTRYSTGSFYHVALNNGTVAGSNAAGYGIGSFTIRVDSALKPTTANRTIGVDAQGNVNANIVNVTQTFNMTGNMTGSVNTVNQTVNANLTGTQTFNITGNMTGSVGSMNGNVNANIVNTVQTFNMAGNMTGSVGSVNSNVNANIVNVLQTFNMAGNVSGSVNSVNQNVTVGVIADNAIGASVIATGAITAAKFAANAIDAAALATSAVTEIATGVWAFVLPEMTVDPGATPTAANGVMLGYMAIRNLRTVDSGNSNETIANNAGATILTACVSDNGTTFQKQKYG